MKIFTFCLLTEEIEINILSNIYKSLYFFAGLVADVVRFKSLPPRNNKLIENLAFCIPFILINLTIFAIKLGSQSLYPFKID
jgi:hypothetical protein